MDVPGGGRGAPPAACEVGPTRKPITESTRWAPGPSNRAAQVSTRAAIHGGAENAGSRARRADDGCRECGMIRPPAPDR